MRSQLALYALFMDFATRRSDAFGVKGIGHYFRKWKKRADIDRIVFFMFDVEPWSPAKIYKKYAAMTPFEKRGGKYFLNEWKEAYFKKLDRFIKIGADEGILLIPNIFPWRYVTTVFRRSAEIGEAMYPYNPMWSIQMRKYEYSLIDRVMEILNVHYKKPWVSLSNETTHSCHDEGFDIALVHKYWLERTELPLERVMLDPSHSEFVIAELVEPHEVFGRVCGELKYARKTNHHVICEHGVGLKHHVDNVIMAYDGSEWKRRTHSIFSSDGNTEGLGEEYVLGTYRNASPKQLYDKCLAVWRASENYIVEELPMEPWVRTPDDYNNCYVDYDKIKLGRLRAIREAREDI